jgi:hypothetical protein
MLRWIFIVLAHWNSSLWVDMWLDSDTLLWFRACCAVQCCVLCEEVANTNSIVFGLTQILNPLPTPFEASTLSSPSLYSLISGYLFLCSPTGHHVRHRMVVTFTTTYAISAYHHWRRALESRSWRGVLSQFTNPKSLYKEGELRNIYMEVRLYKEGEHREVWS